MHVFSVFHAGSEPYVRRSVACRVSLHEVCHTFGSFSEYLKLVPMCLAHYIKDFFDELEWDIRVKQVAHGVYENALWFAPSERSV